jgi:hypothetical protein
MDELRKRGSKGQISKHKCVRCGRRKKPNRSRLTPSGGFGQPDPIFIKVEGQWGVGIM